MTSQPLASAISKMFSGTLVSRILGQVRLIVLVAAIGATGQADAFTVANTLPNTIYNLLAGGVLNAILVPQIVRALTRKDGDEYVNRLLTVAGTFLFVATVVLTAGSALLVTLYASQMSPEWFALAVAFAFWCIPQVFFYGVYTLLGNVLNARGVFGPYMWAPVVNNIVAISGLLAYIWVFGSAASGSGTDPADWTGQRIAMVGGFATLGVILQALVLIVPLRRSGFRYRPQWGLRGYGLGGASRMAMWTFGALAVGQLGYLMLVNVASAASGAQDDVAAFVPANTAYAGAFAIYMLPQSLITTSLVTALFTRMSTHAAARDGAAVRADMSFGLRVVGVFTVFAAAAFSVLAIPVVQAVIPTANPLEAVGFAAVLMALSLGIPAQGIWTMDQRVSYAYEDARTLFWIQVPMAAIIVAGGFVAFLAPPQWWVPIVSGASALSLHLGALVGYLALRKKLPSLDGTRVLRTYLRLTLAVLPAAAAGWITLHYWGPVSGADAGMGSFATAVVKVLAIGSLMAVIYIALLRRLDVDELDEILQPALRFVRRRRTAAVATPPAAPNMGSGGGEDGKEPVVRALAGSLLGGRFRLDSELGTTASGATLWSGHDRVLDRAVTVLVDESDSAGNVLDAARRASLIDDNRFARIVDTGRDRSGAVFVVSEHPEGTTLTDLAGHLSPASVRAVVGETAAALEAARRRGVHHGALEPSRVVVTRDGNVVITGLGYLAIADELDEQHPDPVEASLTRSRADARELSRLQAFLTSGSVPDSADEHANAGEVMRSLAPWEEITLPTEPAPPRANPLWRRIRQDQPAAPMPVAPMPAAPLPTTPAVPPPPPPPVDTSSWSPRRGTHATNPAPSFDDLFDGEVTGSAHPAHASAVPAPWKVLLPGQAVEPPEGPAETTEPTEPAESTEPAEPAESTEPAGSTDTEEPPADKAEQESAAEDEQPFEEHPTDRRSRFAATGAALAGAAAGAAATARSASAAVARRAAEHRARAEQAREEAHERAEEQAAQDAEPTDEMLTTGERPIPDETPTTDEPSTTDETLTVGEPVTVDETVTDASEDVGESVSRRGMGLSVAAAAAARTASDRVQVSSTQVRRQAIRAREASMRAAGASVRRLDTFVTKHDIHVPGELESEDNAALPFSERRLDPGPFVILLMVIAVVVATLLAVTNLLSIGEPAAEASSTPTVEVPAATAEPTPEETAAAPAEAAPDAPAVVPTISSIGVLDPQGDGAENPELTPRALDGDPETFWRSRSYVNPEYGMKVGIGLDIVLTERAPVSEVELTLNGEGGHVQVKADPADAVNGPVIAEADMGRTTVIELPEGTELTNVVLWFTSLPVADSDGKNRVELLEVAVR